MRRAERPTQAEDHQLLRSFLAGDASACRAVERWARQIVRFRPYGIPRDECDDVVQQSVSMLWRACAKSDFTLRTSLRALVRTIVMARCIDWLRRRRATFELDEGLVDPRPGPEQASVLEDEWARVRWALQRLGEGCREIIRLHFLEELPYAEIAVRSGRAEATLRVRMFNCMKEIRRLLGAVVMGSVLWLSASSIAPEARAASPVEDELEARQRIEDLESQRAPDSLALAAALDQLVDALTGRGMARDPETRLAARRSLGIRERALGPSHRDVAASWVRTGDLFYRIGDYRAARPAYERALAIREKAAGPDLPEVAESLERLAGLHHRLASYAAARPLLERALAIREKTSGAGSTEVAIDLNNLALLLAQHGEQARARPLLERALAIAETTVGASHPYSATMTYNLAAAIEDLGDLAAARPLAERALETWIKTLVPELPDPRWLSNIIAFLPKDLSADFPGKHIIEERALRIWEMALGPGHPRVWPRFMKSRNLIAGGVSRQWWEPMLGRLLSLAEKVLGPEHPDLAYVLNMLANNDEEIGDFTDARRVFERAVALSEGSVGPTHPDVAMSVNNLAVLIGQMGDYAEARRLYRRAEAVYAGAFGSGSREVAMVLSNLGMMEAERGRWGEARTLDERALAIWEKVEDPEHPDVAYALTNLAIVHEESGDLAGARTLYERALRLKERALYGEHPDIVSTLTGLGRLDAAAGDWSAARRKCERALAVIRKANGEENPAAAYCLMQLARVEMNAGATDSALNRALQAEEIAREHLRVTSRALSEREALRYASERQSGLDLALSIACERGADTTAVRRVWDALVRSRAIVFDEMASRHRVVASSNDPEVAELATDLAAARERLAHLSVGSMRAGAAGADPSRLEHAREEKEDLERKLAERDAVFRAERARSQIGLSEVTAALQSGDALVAYARFLRSVPGRNASGTPFYVAFVARGDGAVRVVPLGAAGTIEADVARWSREIARGSAAPPWREAESEARCRAAGTALRRAIWDPLEPFLNGADRVLMVPDGSIHLVSFPALPDRKGYLVEAGPLLHELSTERDLVSLPGAVTSGNRGLLALGGPDFGACESPSADLVPSSWEKAVTDSGGAEREGALLAQRAPIFRGTRSGCGEFRSLRFDPLPASAQEAQWIAKLWSQCPQDAMAGASEAGVPDQGPEDQALALTAARAGEGVLKRLAPGRRILHIATHGFFVDSHCGARVSRDARGNADDPGENPLLLSGLALAGANRREGTRGDQEDGILTAEEIAALDLSGVEWAVLSACNTGLGKLQSGEGVFGLKRAFLVAGAGTVIMSLWSVEDEDVRRWMQALYQARLLRRRDTASAVREASLEVLRERRAAGQGTHPVHWAAFVAAGEWR